MDLGWNVIKMKSLNTTKTTLSILPMPRSVIIKKKQTTSISELIKVIGDVKLDILRQISDDYQLSIESLSEKYLRKPRN